jgi:aryl carrier-like protein
MIPSQFVFMEALPLTPNGKLDRRALPAPDAARRNGGRKNVAPRTPAEELLCEVWREVLGVERVGVEENFFELGGDSILSIQVVSHAQRRGLRLTPRQLFQHQTVAHAGRRLDAEEGGRARTNGGRHGHRGGSADADTAPFLPKRVGAARSLEPDGTAGSGRAGN